MLMRAIWFSGTTVRWCPPHRQALEVLGIDAVVLVQPHRDVARLPIGSTQSPTSTPAKATRSACAASPTEMPSWLARPAIELDLQFVLGLLLRQADVHRARDLRSSSM
jgi:hypothetical protein